MPFLKNIFVKLSVAVLLIFVIPAPSEGAKKGKGVGEFMAQLEVAYVETVKSIMLSPVQDEDDISFDQAAGWAEEITKAAALLARLEEFKKNKSAQTYLRQLAAQSHGIQRLAKSKRWDGMVVALFRLQATCIGCHKEHRN
ncbi:MAG: hypothetical protein HOC91_19150 [Nitrospinaceae bacterium]|jgi:hypothetical protein|nr:hypothetical protein [Nitrospinaceae bacterium]MBT3433267.1 hypothetical protein [Nitrospinaceae bacterium]MBT3823289.1 hypothetical protein [Nitrospinaceae bacterium]MBT4092994.1 hypothetical protein [Nitrospinaceae bacterium]MBT4432634.1 hypothetical protein [Nitrospinaceae bacterium]